MEINKGPGKCLRRIKSKSWFGYHFKMYWNDIFYLWVFLTLFLFLIEWTCWLKGKNNETKTIKAKANCFIIQRVKGLVDKLGEVSKLTKKNNKIK